MVFASVPHSLFFLRSLGRMATTASMIRTAVIGRLGPIGLTVLLFVMVVMAAGCATTAIPPAPPTAELGSGRFALRGSFLPEPSQGRFEWRTDALGRGSSGLSGYQEVLIQDPWGQAQGVFSWRPDQPGPWAGWSLTDPRGRPVLPEQFPAKPSTGLSGPSESAQTSPNPTTTTTPTSLLSTQGLQALAELLHQLQARLQKESALPSEGRQAFTLRQTVGSDWVELRIVLDNPRDCRPLSDAPGRDAGPGPGCAP
ncbi:MAG: hypothetical protein ACO3DD_05120 [Burkholderiaceae bacterium]